MINNYFIAFFLSIFCLILPLKQVQAYQDVQELKTKSGLEFWLIEDKSVPVITLNFAFAGGIAQDPSDKLGRASLLSSMLTKGADDLDENEFEEYLADHSIRLSFNAGRDDFYGSLKTLSRYKDTAKSLLKKALAAPHFEESVLNRIKQKTLISLKQKQATPSWLLWRNFNDIYYQDHPYTKPGQGFKETIESLSADDLRNFMDLYFARSDLKITLAGDISAPEAKIFIDEIFEDLKETSAYEAPQPFVRSSTFEDHHIDFDVPQTFIVMGRQGLDENDPDWAALKIANYLIGGGSFSSLLMEEVRVKRGLTYGITSFTQTQKFADTFLIQTSTSTDKAKEMKEVISQSLNQALLEGFTTEQMKDAKAYLIGSMPLSLTDMNSIGKAYLSLKVKGLPANYLQARVEALENVTQNDLKRATARLLGDLSFVTITVGKKADKVEE